MMFLYRPFKEIKLGNYYQRKIERIFRLMKTYGKEASGVFHD